jgi:hypothetical protein
VIFLSYTCKDRTAARTIDAVLRGKGLDVWIDFRYLNPRRDIINQLETAIRRCSLFLALTPANGQNYPWMAAEQLIAIQSARPILQLTTDATVLDHILTHLPLVSEFSA